MRHGETVDLTALYETYSDLLFRTALTYVSHSEDAQDVVHDVFAVYLAKRPTFQDTSHQRAWMLRVTINKCRISSAATRYAGIPFRRCGTHRLAGGFRNIRTSGRRSSLPDKPHEVVVLHYLEGFSVEETARCLRISVSAVKMRLTRGRQAIKALL